MIGDEDLALHLESICTEEITGIELDSHAHSHSMKRCLAWFDNVHSV